MGFFGRNEATTVKDAFGRLEWLLVNRIHACKPTPAAWQPFIFLLLLAGAGLRVSEMTQIRAEDVDFSKGYLHVPAVNAKFKKPRTMVLLPQVAQAISKQLAGRTKGWLFQSYRDRHITSRQVQNILDDIATRTGLQEVNAPR